MRKSIFRNGSLFGVLFILVSLLSFKNYPYGDMLYEFSYDQSQDHDTLYYPAIDSSETVLHHRSYDFVYDESHEQSKWVFYKLSPSMINGPYERKNNFRKDPLVVSGTASNEDYRGSGYDRGHLMPAADMAWSSESMSESFFYSNMSPQFPSFNRGIWKRLENRVRKWALECDSMYVFTGPLLNPELDFIGVNHVSVPEYYFKVILRFNNNSKECIGFLMPNKSSKNDLTEFVFSVDSIESESNIDFFKFLNDSTEKRLQRKANTNLWVW